MQTKRVASVRWCQQTKHRLDTGTSAFLCCNRMAAGTSFQALGDWGRQIADTCLSPARIVRLTHTTGGCDIVVLQSSAGSARTPPAAGVSRSIASSNRRPAVPLCQWAARESCVYQVGFWYTPTTALLLLTRDAACRSALLRGRAGAPAAPCRAAAGSSRCAGRSQRQRAARTRARRPRRAARRPGRASTCACASTCRAASGGRGGVRCVHTWAAASAGAVHRDLDGSAPAARTAHSRRVCSRWEAALPFYPRTQRLATNERVWLRLDEVSDRVPGTRRQQAATRRAPAAPGLGYRRRTHSQPGLSHGLAAPPPEPVPPRASAADPSPSLVVAACRRRRTPGCLSANATRRPPAPCRRLGCSSRRRGLGANRASPSMAAAAWAMVVATLASVVVWRLRF
eukprot:scaffold129087_cov66-Phaeocystis_antarctica.AAC.8